VTGELFRAGRFGTDIGNILHDHVTHTVVYDNVSDAIDDIINRPSNHASGLGNSSETASSGWAGSKNLGDAISILKGGWSEYREQVERIFGDITEDPDIETMRSKSFAWQLSDEGDFCNTDLYAEGEAECMYLPILEEAERPDAIIRIVVDGTAASGVKPDEIIRKGIVIAALVDTLQFLGRGVELWWGQSVAKNNAASIMAVKVKDTRTHMDIDDMLFACAHPSMLRRFGFALFELEDESHRRTIGLHSKGRYGRVKVLDSNKWGGILGETVHVLFNGMEYGRDYRDGVQSVKNLLEGMNF